MSKELVTKVKRAIERSGFPLELQIARYLSKRKWSNWIGHYFRDYETFKDREIDIKAYKEIKKTAIHLNISCKKTQTKQLVLYTPSLGKAKAYLRNPLVAFPDTRKIYSLRDNNPLRFLNVLNPEIPWAKNVLLVSGEKVVQDNVDLMSSLNALVKSSMMSASDGYCETGWRMTFHYILVWDGPLFKMSTAESDSFQIEEVSHGVLEYHYPLRITQEMEKILHLRDLFFKVGDDHHIEIVKPEAFESILENIESCFEACSSEFLKEWGTDSGSM